MARVYISEYSIAQRDEKGIALPIAQEPALVEQTPVSISGASLQSAAFNSQTKYVRLHGDGVFSFVFGSNPTATTDSKRVAAGISEYYGVNPGDKVAIIANT